MKHITTFQLFESLNENRLRSGRLKALCDLWKFDPIVIEKIFKEMQGSFDQTDEYLEMMDSLSVDDPAEAWDDWIHEHNIEHENNPFIS